MSWLFSKALMDSYENSHCSLGQGGASLGANSLDGKPSAPLNGNPTQLAYLPPDRMTGFSRLSRFGMTFRPLTENLGAELLMSYLAAFPVRTYPQPEREQESPEVNQVCGNTWHELLMKYDPDSHSWKTVRCLFPEELQWSSVTLPTWGMTLNGALFQHQTLVRPISGIGFGSEPNNEKLSTPQATDHISKRTSAFWKAKGGVNYSLSNPEIQMMWPTPRVLEVDESYENYISRMQKSGNPKNIGKTKPNNLTMAVNLWPTPAARDGNPTNTLDTLTEGRFVDQLANRVKMVANNIWATPHSRDWKGTTITKNHPNGFNRSLVDDVIKWPTPTANEDACGKPTGKMQKMLGNHPEVRQDPNGGVLNADWVEWLMGWPIGWTKLEPLESVTEFDETWWDVEPVPRVLIGATARADRLKAIGNGQVSRVAATAFRILSGQ